MEIDVRHVLIAGESGCFHFRAGELLPPPGFKINFVSDASRALEIIQKSHFDIVLVEFGENKAVIRDLAKNLRWSGSPSRNAIAALLCTSDELDEAEEFLFSGFSRILNPEAPDAVLVKVLDEVLNSEPRYPVRALIRIKGEDLGQEGVIMTQTANLSATGMLVHFERPVLIGCQFAFTLELPGLSEGIRGTASVVRLALGRDQGLGGFAARFSHFEGGYEETLRRFLAAQRPPQSRTAEDI